MPDLSHIPTVFPKIFLVVLALVVFGALVRRVPVLGTLVSLVTWVGVIGLLIVALGQQSTISPYLDRAMRALKIGGQEVVGTDLHIRMAPDGHFWVRARFGGVERRMLIDSGATQTALSTATAAAAGLTVRDPAIPILMRTANGTVVAQTATIPELRMGSIVARDLAVVVAPGLGDTDVIGMNLLSRLKSWRVEEQVLILVPHHPQPVETPA
ncbi:MAG TPA: TIGR02281 family clan AA aspartic protease [Sphingomonas sp.]|jgi:aspartyl protease family protein|nr:TIGR02281 family clan AA aspartic protease [Sphingomonas sp.]